jgi:hypothetical protein
MSLEAITHPVFSVAIIVNPNPYAAAASDDR